MKVEWLPAATDGLATQLAWIGDRDPWAAIGVGDAITAAVERQADHPRLGRPGRVRGTRGLVVVGTPHVVVYRIEATAVIVLRFLHVAQRWPPA